MAIKGKSKGKTPKAVTRGPKPAYVPVKQPILARRGFWIGVGVVLGLVLLLALVIGILAQRERDREAALQERMAATVEDYRAEVEPILAAVGQPVPPSTFAAFPQLSDAVAQLEADLEGSPADADVVAETADAVVISATSALEAVEAIDETLLIRGKGFEEDFVLNLINSKGNMIRALLLYVEAAELTSSAAAVADGPRRDELLPRARGVLDVASELFARGYGDYVEAQIKAGVFESPDPFAGVPGPTGTS